MDACGLGSAPIDAVLITHEHVDHVGSARILDDRLYKLRERRIPFFMTPGTASSLNPKVCPQGVELVEAGEEFTLGTLDIDPFPIPHDTRDPVAFRVGRDGRWVGVVTDLGRPTALVQQRLSSMTVAVLEFNHDMEMLMSGNYPWHLKQRIRSNHGHLSNLQAASLLEGAVGGELRQVILAHLSEENNHPMSALTQANRVLVELGAQEEVGVLVADQKHPLSPASVPLQGPMGRAIEAFKA
jgi:phosphoribosyl 1,2-cyclic phosphodiesterase